MSANKELTFFEAVKPLIHDVVAAVPELYPEVVAAQWADESEWNPGGIAANYPSDTAARGVNNFAGITNGRQLINFATTTDFVRAYVTAIQANWYDAVRSAKDPQEQAKALGESPWAAGHYMPVGGYPGETLVQILLDFANELKDVFYPQSAAPTSDPAKTTVEPTTSATTAQTAQEPTSLADLAQHPVGYFGQKYDALQHAAAILWDAGIKQ